MIYTDASSLAAFFQQNYPLMTQGLVWDGDLQLFYAQGSDPAFPIGSVDVEHQIIFFWDPQGFTDRALDTSGNVIGVTQLKAWGFTTPPFSVSSVTDWIAENPMLAIAGAFGVYALFLAGSKKRKKAKK